MPSCSCGGNNENCYKCFGRGSYGNMPKPVKANAIKPKMQTLGRAPIKTKHICTVCGQVVGSYLALDTHRSSKHADCFFRWPTPDSIRTKLHANDTHHFSIQTGDNLCNICKKKLKTATGLAQHIRIKHLDAVVEDVRRKQSTINFKPLITCPECKCSLGVNKLAKHLLLVHQSTQVVAHKKANYFNSYQPAPIPPLQQSTELKAQRIVHPEGAQNPCTSMPWVNESKYDGSRGYHDFAWEENRYSSHPTHDDYGEESNV